MQFKELDSVKLKESDDLHGVKETFMGVVVDVQNNGDAVCVEFFDEDNETVLEALDHYYSPNELVLVKRN